MAMAMAWSRGAGSWAPTYMWGSAVSPFRVFFLLLFISDENFENV